MKAKLVLGLMCIGLVGCATDPQQIADLRDAKVRVLQLHPGMKRAEAEAILHPLPEDVPDPEWYISMYLPVTYMLHNNIRVDVQYYDANTIVFSTPEEIAMRSRYCLIFHKYKKIPISQIQ
jgi:hypothetical protein